MTFGVYSSLNVSKVVVFFHSFNFFSSEKSGITAVAKGLSVITVIFTFGQVVVKLWSSIHFCREAVGYQKGQPLLDDQESKIELMQT